MTHCGEFRFIDIEIALVLRKKNVACIQSHSPVVTLSSCLRQGLFRNRHIYGFKVIDIIPKRKSEKSE